MRVSDFSRVLKERQISPVKSASFARRDSSKDGDAEKKERRFFRSLFDPLPQLSLPPGDPKDAAKLRIAQITGNDALACAEAAARQESALNDSSFNFTHTRERTKGVQRTCSGDNMTKVLVLSMPMSKFQPGAHGFSDFRWNDNVDGAPLVHSVLVLFAEIVRQMRVQHDQTFKKLNEQAKKNREQKRQGNNEQKKEGEDEKEKELYIFDDPTVLWEVVADSKLIQTIEYAEMDPVQVAKLVNENPNAIAEIRLIITYSEALKIDNAEQFLSKDKQEGSSLICVSVC